jgi:hypothetical protein
MKFPEAWRLSSTVAPSSLPGATAGSPSISVQSLPLPYPNSWPPPTSQSQKPQHGSETSNHNIKNGLWHPLLLLAGGQWQHCHEQSAPNIELSAKDLITSHSAEKTLRSQI